MMTIAAVSGQTSQTSARNINNLLVKMGLKVDEAVNQAVVALLGSSNHFVSGLMENAVAIQEMETAVDRAIFCAVDCGALPSSQIRSLTTLVNINKDLARLGKLAASLGRKVSMVGEHRVQEDFSRLQPLAIAVYHLCHQTLRSLARRDLLLARNAASTQASVDAYRNYAFRDLHPSNVTNPFSEQDVHLIFASRCLEQIADHASDLAENLVSFLTEQAEPGCLQPEAYSQRFAVV
jgi:phosphate transport system protein